MLINFLKRFTFLISFIVSFSLYASDSSLDQGTSSGSSSSRKRTNEALNETSFSFGQQVFGRPTYDTTAKYVLSDDMARLDFIKTFTGITNITSTETLDNSLTPIHQLTNVRELLTDPQIKNFMRWVKQDPLKYTVMEQGTPPAEAIEISGGNKLIRELSHCFDDLVKTFPKSRASQVDVLCLLSTGDYALVEIQVIKQDYWDERALAYLASVYGNQLQAGGQWHELKKVIGINILGGGPKNIKYWGVQSLPFRHYIFQDKYDSQHVIKTMELIQYSLGDTNLDADIFSQQKNLKDWLDYFKNAHMKEDIPDDVSEGLKNAYKRSRIADMPEEVKKGYAIEEELYWNLSEHEERVKELGKAEGKTEGKAEGKAEGKMEEKREIARKMLMTDLSSEMISTITELSVVEIEEIKEELKKALLDSTGSSST